MVGDTSTFWKKFAHIYHKPTLLLVQTFDSNCQQDYSYGFSDTSSFPTPFGFFSDYAEEKTDIKAVKFKTYTLHLTILKIFLNICWKFTLENTTEREHCVNCDKTSRTPTADVHLQMTLPWQQQLQLFLGGPEGVISFPWLWVHTYLSSYAEQARCIQPPFLAGTDGCQGCQVGIPLPHLGKLLLLHLPHREKTLFSFYSVVISKSYLQTCSVS